MDQPMTVKEAIANARQQLLNISVPRALNEQIGVPIDRVAGLLQACLEAIERNEMERTEAENIEAEEAQDGDADAE